jgi:tetratricopeptide (TPR) repeat protein
LPKCLNPLPKSAVRQYRLTQEKLNCAGYHDMLSIKNKIRSFLIGSCFACPLLSFAQSKGIIPYKQTGIVTQYLLNLTLKQADSLVASNPAHPDYYDWRGEVYFKLNKTDEAYKDYSKAISIEPTEPTFYLHRGLLLVAAKQPVEAIADYNDAVNLIKNNDRFKFDVIISRGIAKADSRDFQGAYEDYLACYHFDSTNVNPIIGLGGVLDDLGREAEAISYLEKGFELSPGNIGINTNLGYRYMMKANYELALRYYNKVLTLDSQDAKVYNNRGFTYYKQKKYEAALNDVNRSLQFFPDNAFAFKNRALIFIATGQKAKACADLETALKFGFTDMYGDEVENLKKQHCK